MQPQQITANHETPYETTHPKINYVYTAHLKHFQFQNSYHKAQNLKRHFYALWAMFIRVAGRAMRQARPAEPKFKPAQVPPGFWGLTPSGNHVFSPDLLFTSFQQNRDFSSKIWNFITKLQTLETFSTDFSGSSPLQDLKLHDKISDWTAGNQISQDKIQHTNQKTDQNLEIVTSHDFTKLPAGAE